MGLDCFQIPTIEVSTSTDPWCSEGNLFYLSIPETARSVEMYRNSQHPAHQLSSIRLWHELFSVTYPTVRKKNPRRHKWSFQLLFIPCKISLYPVKGDWVTHNLWHKAKILMFDEQGYVRKEKGRLPFPLYSTIQLFKHTAVKTDIASSKSKRLASNKRLFKVGTAKALSCCQ